jgi:hypothetical protein
MRISFSDLNKTSREWNEHQAAREEWRKNELFTREIRELSQCSFKPRVASPPKLTTDPIVVRGLNRFLELRAMSIQRKREAEQRDKEAFRVTNVDQYRDRITGHTLVQVWWYFISCTFLFVNFVINVVLTV